MDASEITVKVVEGVVLLAGRVESKEQRLMAANCVKHVSGVGEIDNQLVVVKKGLIRDFGIS